MHEWADSNQRGWVVQERILARRVVHHSRSELFWECRELSASESYPDGLPSHMLRHNSRREPSELLSEVCAHDHHDMARRSEVWCRIVEDYTAAQLSVATDKLPALSGIACHVKGLSLGDYHAGVWTTGIHRFLAWKSRVRKQSLLAEIRAPTWSWASTDNVVDYSIGRGRKTWNSETEPIFALGIMDIHTSLSSSDPTGAVSGGYILVKGPLNQVTLDRRLFHHGSSATFVDFDRLHLALPYQDCMYKCDVRLDDYPSAHFNPSAQYNPNAQVNAFMDIGAYALPLYYSNGDAVLLLLQPSAEHPGCYVRIGIGWYEAGSERPSEMFEGREDITTLLKVQNAFDVPCERYLGPKEGHLIRII